jgi:hypothetical protein
MTGERPTMVGGVVAVGGTTPPDERNHVVGAAVCVAAASSTSVVAAQPVSDAAAAAASSRPSRRRPPGVICRPSRPGAVPVPGEKVGTGGAGLNPRAGDGPTLGRRRSPAMTTTASTDA